MKKYFLALIVVGTLCACSEESKVQEAAIAEAKAQFQSERKEEFAQSIKGKINIQNTAVRILTDKSEFQARKIKINGNKAEANVEVLTVPAKARNALIDIMIKLDGKKEDLFNVADALQMILNQMGLTETRSLLVYKVKLEKTDAWQAARN